MIRFGKFTYYGNPFIGLFARTNNKVTITSISSPDKFSRMAEILDTEFIRTSFAGSALVGLYSVMNDHGILLSEVVDDSEVDKLKNDFKSLDIDMEVTKLESRFTAISNNIALNNKCAVINPNMADEHIVKMISDALDVDVEAMNVAGYNTVGATVAATNKGFITHPSISAEELEILKNVLGVDGGVGTVNGGMPFISLGIVANDERAIVGELTTGFELHRIEESLGLIR
jgi:translation initiation factor 6